ncbi:MAG: MBL fold metallo-hydrolase [Bacillota bacterium]|nr:MBL fold metallo-hydrolase [Bacillota bacterium]
MKLKWYGTACISLETEKDEIIFDPYIPRKGSETPSAEEEYLRFKNILVTHGHFDHISTIPETVSKSGATVWCTKTPFETLVYKGVSPDNMKIIFPGDVLNFGDMKVTVFQSRHVKFDAKLIFSTAFSLRPFKYFSNLVELIGENKVCPEANETVGYLIEAEGKRIYLMASMNWVEDVEYPQNVDLLILPFQGASDLVTPGLKFIEMTQPKAVLLDHFDDTFPPMSNHIDTSGMVKALEGRLPLTIPVYGETYEI